MNANQAPVKSADLVSSTLEDGTVIVSPEGGEVRVLNEVGSTIWQMIDGQNTVSDITILLSQKYSVSSIRAGNDVESFLVTLQERGLITWPTQETGES